MGGGGERRGEEAAEQLEEWRQAESEGQRRRRRRGETEEREDGGRGEVGLDDNWTRSHKTAVDEKFGSGEGDVASAFFTTSFQNRVERCGEAKTDGLLITLMCLHGTLGHIMLCHESFSNK
jgi:hypothetical protein